MYKTLCEIANQIIDASSQEILNNITLCNKIKKLLSVVKEEYEVTKTPPDAYKLFIFFSSFLYHADNDSSHIISIFDEILKNKNISHYTKYFYFWQVSYIIFTDSNFRKLDISRYTKQVYKQIFEAFKKELDLSEKRISKNERNRDVIFIITSQFLSLSHAPTKTALDRAVSLVKYFNKKLFLINTADILTSVGREPFYKIETGTIIDYSADSVFSFNSISFKFYQPKSPMPNISEIKKIIDCVIKYKPYFILNIGGSNVVSDLCSLFVPTITQATVFSGLPLTLGTFSVTANPKLRVSENIILTTFTFDYKPQTHTYTRADFSLPENKFLIIISGLRLTEEVRYEFLKEISEIFNYNAHIVFCGAFNTYDKIAKTVL